MFESVWQFVQHQLATNQFFSGGLVLMLVGGLAAYFRALPSRVWAWLRGLWIIEIDILDRDPAFEWIDQWLAQHSYSQRYARWLTVKTQPVDYRSRREQPDADFRPRILFSPSPGRHLLLYRGRLVVLHRQRPEPGQNAGQMAAIRESFSITIYSRDRGIARKLLEDARDVALPPGDTRLSLYRQNYGSWTCEQQRQPRPAESVVLREGLMDDLLDDVRSFLHRRTWYVERGLPYRRGYLLHGPPGTGKSSAALAIASELKMDLALLSLTRSSLDDNELCSLLAEVPANAIVLIEDIDCAFIQREHHESSKVGGLTFSGLLNALDGVAAGEGRVLFATTNHPERLDPALVRPGRIDRRVEIGYATKEQAGRFFARFFPNGDPAVLEYFVDSIPERRLSMSAIQTHLIRYAHDADEAVERLDELLTGVVEDGDSWQSAAEDSSTCAGL